MTATFPLPRQARESDVIVAEEGQFEFGPFDFVLYDTDDNIVLARAPAGGAFEDVTADTNNVPVAGSFPSLFLTVFNEGLPAGTEVQVVGRRIHERSTNVTQGGAIRSVPLEGELTRQGAVLQELRRDVDRADPAPAIAAAAEAEQHMEAAEQAATAAGAALGVIQAIIAASAANLLIIQNGAPSDEDDGVDGNLYIDTSHARLAVYGPKAAGAWGAPIGFVIGLDGEMAGPETSTDNAIPRFNGTDGTTLKNSSATIDDNGHIIAPRFIASGAEQTAAALKFTDNGAGVGPIADLERESASPEAGDSLGRLNFSGRNDADEKGNYANITAQIVSAEEGDESGQFYFQAMIDGVLTTLITWGKNFITGVASAANMRAATAGKLLSTEGVYGAQAPVALTDASPIAIDFATFTNATVTIGADRTFGDPSNEAGVIGKTGWIKVTASGGTRTITKHADMKCISTLWASAISIPSGQSIYIYYEVEGANNIQIVGIRENPA